MTPAEEIYDQDGLISKYGWPPALAKSAIDPYGVAIMLTTGTIIVYSGCIPSTDRKWARLMEPVVRLHDGSIPGEKAKFNMDLPMSFDRGIDVRVDQIVWAADAPWGS